MYLQICVFNSLKTNASFCGRLVTMKSMTSQRHTQCLKVPKTYPFTVFLQICIDKIFHYRLFYGGCIAVLVIEMNVTIIIVPILHNVFSFQWHQVIFELYCEHDTVRISQRNTLLLELFYMIHECVQNLYKITMQHIHKTYLLCIQNS